MSQSNVSRMRRFDSLSSKPTEPEPNRVACSSGASRADLTFATTFRGLRRSYEFSVFIGLISD